MKSRPLEMCLLFDFYGDILTDKQKELFDLYYNEDYSLAEIAENAGITRQGVRDSIVRAENTLREMEDKLRLVARYGRIPSLMAKLKDAAETIQLLNESRYRNVEIAVQTDNILRITDTILD